MFEKSHRSMFDRGSQKEVVGIYLVLKQNKKSRDRSAELEHFGGPRGFGGPMHQHSAYESPAQRRSSQSGYEPRHSQPYSRREPSRRTGRYASKESYKRAHQEPESDDGYPEVEEVRLIRGQRNRSEQRRSKQRQSQQRELSSDYDSYPSDLHTPQRSSRERERIYDTSDPGHLPKSVSFAETPVPPAGYPYAQYPAPYAGYPPPPGPQILYPISPDPYPGYPGYPDLRPRRNRDDALYDTVSALPQRFASPRQSRSRSRSPRPIRRSGTGKYPLYHQKYLSLIMRSLPDESYRSADSLTSPAQGPYPPGHPAHKEAERPGRPQLSDIQELDEDSDVSISSEHSDDD